MSERRIAGDYIGVEERKTVKGSQAISTHPLACYDIWLSVEQFELFKVEMMKSLE